MNEKIFEKFWRLTFIAAKNGGVWVSAAGGTQNVAAGTISRMTGLSYNEAHDGIERHAPHGDESWWNVEAANPWPYMAMGDYVPRWDIETVARAAVSSRK